MTTVNLDSEFVSYAKKYAGVNSRSLPKQIEYWARIGKIAEENPDLSYEFIKGILVGMQDIECGDLSEYKLDDSNVNTSK